MLTQLACQFFSHGLWTENDYRFYKGFTSQELSKIMQPSHVALQIGRCSNSNRDIIMNFVPFACNMKTTLGSSYVKYLTARQSLGFLSLSLPAIWGWMFLCSKIDRGYDRGFLSSSGLCIIVSIFLGIFFSKNVLVGVVATFFRLLVSGLFIIMLSIAVTDLTILPNLTWIEFITPYVLSAIAMYSILRQLFSFPNNPKALLVMFLLPGLAAIIISILPFYDGIFAHDYGIGFPLCVYLTLVFVSISILCHRR